MSGFLARARAALADIAERAAWTFVQAFVGALSLPAVLAAIGPDGVDVDVAVGVVGAAAAAGVAAVLSLLKGIVAAQQGTGDAALPSQ